MQYSAFLLSSSLHALKYDTTRHDDINVRSKADQYSQHIVYRMTP